MNRRSIIGGKEGRKNLPLRAERYCVFTAQGLLRHFIPRNDRKEAISHSGVQNLLVTKGKVLFARF